MALKSLYIITQKGGRAFPSLLKTILGTTGVRVSGVAFLTWRAARSTRLGNGVRDRIQIYGIRDWAIRQALGLSRRVSQRIGANGVRHVLKRHGIPWSEIHDVNDPAFLNRLRGLAPDLVLCVFALQRFGSDLLGIPRVGCINLHPAHLPECRGLYSSFWSLYKGEREHGVTIHFMTDEWDAGPIIAERRFPISPGETVHSLSRKKLAIMPALLSEALDALIQDRVVLRENDRDRGAYYSVPSRETFLAFRKERRGRWY